VCRRGDWKGTFFKAGEGRTHPSWSQQSFIDWLFWFPMLSSKRGSCPYHLKTWKKCKFLGPSPQLPGRTPWRWGPAPHVLSSLPEVWKQAKVEKHPLQFSCSLPFIRW
jgi:hypothetical protein